MQLCAAMAPEPLRFKGTGVWAQTFPEVNAGRQQLMSISPAVCSVAANSAGQPTGISKDLRASSA